MKLGLKTFFWAVAVIWAMIDVKPALAQDLGNATYYSNRLHGRRVSDGSRYHKDSLTCAHKTYPFGSILKVRNPRNGSEVFVKVTDRGPFRRGAIVDLSLAAAKEIGIVQAGVAAVICDVVLTMGRSVLGERRVLPVVMLLGAFAAARFFGVNVVAIILVCGAVGAADLWRRQRTSKGGRAQ